MKAGIIRPLTTKEARDDLFRLYREAGKPIAFIQIEHVSVGDFNLSIANSNRPIREVYSVARFFVGPIDLGRIRCGSVERNFGLWDTISSILEVFKSYPNQDSNHSSDQDLDVPILTLVTAMKPADVNCRFGRFGDLPSSYNEALETIVHYWEDYFHSALLYDLLYLTAAYQRGRRQQQIANCEARIKDLEVQIRAMELKHGEVDGMDGEIDGKDRIHGLRRMIDSYIEAQEGYFRPEMIHLRVDYGPEGILLEIAEAIHLAYSFSSMSGTRHGSSTSWPLSTNIFFKLSDEPEVTISQGYRAPSTILSSKNQTKPPTDEIERLNLKGEGAGDVKVYFDAAIASESE